ncbi:hypothetical protein MCOR25_008208 [Pyricularia grisea]|nr:hypothetical protein MCOR25_008208 [Pyricularia grisea]
MQLEGLALASYVLGWITCSISTTFASLRLFARYREPGLSWDDAYLVSCILVVFVSKSVCHFAWFAGLGRSLEQIPLADRPRAIFLSTLATAIIPWEFTLPKLAIVVFIHKIVPTSKRRFRSWLAACALSFALILCISVWQFAQCNPTSQRWAPVPGGKCADPRINVAMAYTSSVVSCVIDVAICLGSIPVFMGLQMSARNKATVIVAVSFGALAFIVAMTKMAFLKDLEKIPEDPTGKWKMGNDKPLATSIGQTPIQIPLSDFRTMQAPAYNFISWST